MGELVDPADSKSAAERRTSSSLVAGTIAGMVELVDTADLKSAALLGVRVRVPFPAPLEFLGGRKIGGKHVGKQAPLVNMTQTSPRSKKRISCTGKDTRMGAFGDTKS